jgi:hypothetical protein
VCDQAHAGGAAATTRQQGVHLNVTEKAKAAKANIASSSFVELEPYDAVVTRPARTRSVEVPQV